MLNRRSHDLSRLASPESRQRDRVLGLDVQPVRAKTGGEALCRRALYQAQPRVADGKAAFIGYFEGMVRDYPDKSVSVKRAVAEGDLVALHCHQVWPGEVLQHWAGIDILRFDGYGKFVEHWDVLQIIPQGGLRSNTMFKP